jgi:glycosyltransferase involved in cell wall biosynthesis
VSGEPQVSVVIPALNAASTIAAQIAALASQFDGTFEVILVDNDSTDDTVAAAQSAAGVMPITTISESTRGANAARNAGIRAARGDKILLCDADDVVSRQWVSLMASHLSPGHWTSGPLDVGVLNDQQTITIRQRTGGPRGSDQPPGTASSNCGFMKCDWDDAGGFDVRLAGNGEETEFFVRLHHGGLRGVFVPNAVVHYRLRPGMKAWIRDQFRAGRSHEHMLSLSLGDTFLAQYSWLTLAARPAAHIALLAIDGWRAGPRARRLGAIAYYAGRVIYRFEM